MDPRRQKTDGSQNFSIVANTTTRGLNTRNRLNFSKSLGFQEYSSSSIIEKKSIIQGRFEKQEYLSNYNFWRSWAARHLIL